MFAFRKGDTKKATRQLRNSTTLVWIVVTHTILATPGNILYIKHTSSPNTFSTLDQDSGVMKFANIAYVCYVLSHAINHVLYCMANKQIQEETGKLLFRCRNLYWFRSPPV